MGTTLRSKLSEKNPYWIEKHRYYELKHFCLQYPYWRRARETITYLCAQASKPVVYRTQTGNTDDPTASVAEAKLFYTNRIELIERVCRQTDPVIGEYILEGVTQGISYDILNARRSVPCSKDTYYDLYRKFFWLLSKERG